MIDCSITIFDENGNSKQIEYAELVNKILGEGIASLHPQTPGNKLAEAIITKYDVNNSPDSIMEMLAKLEAKKQGVSIAEYPTADDIEDLLYPKGDLNEFATQLKIKENTDVGASSTGISANSGKTIAYTFDAEPIKGIFILEDGKFVFHTGTSDKVKATLKAENVGTMEDLVRKRPLMYKAGKLEDVELKAAYHVNYAGNEKWDKFSRFEIDPYTRTTFKIGNYRVSIFETIDTMINLSIDNVKEQKLFLLGIQVNSANAFFSALAMGIPLPDVVLMFKQDIIDNVTKKGRLSKDNIESEYPALLKTIATSESSLVAEALEHFGANTGLANTLLDFAKSDNASGLQDKLRKTLSIDRQDLEILYTHTGQKDHLLTTNPVIKAITELVLLDNLKRLSHIGNQLFTRSQSLTILRKYPSSRWKMESILQAVDETETSHTEKNLETAMVTNYHESMKNALAKYEEYKNVLGDAYEDLVPQELTRRATINDTIRRSTVRDFTASGSSVFKNNALMRLPHFFSAHRGLVMLSSMIDQIFPIHSPIVRTFAKDIMRMSNINDTFQVHKNVEYIQREFMKFLSTGLKVKIDDHVVDLTIDVEAGENIDRWALEHIDRTMRAAREITGNAFLEAIQQQWTGELALIADKMADEPAIERIKQGFVQLYTNTEEIGSMGITGTELALDMFKYAIMTQGLYFGRTNMALVFPETWAGAHSKVLKSRLNKIIKGKVDARADDSFMKAFANLEALKEVFLYQFLRNNPGMVRYVPAKVAKPIITSREYDSKANLKDILSGYEEVKTEKGTYKVYYDLAFDTPYIKEKATKPTLPKFIRRYDNRVYMRLETEGAEKTYYRILIEETEHKAYQFEESQLTESLDISKIADPTIPTIPFSATIMVGRDRYIANAKEAGLENGSIVHIVNRNHVYPKAVIVHRVSEIKDSLQVLTKNYSDVAKLTPIKSIPTTKVDEIQKIHESISAIEPVLSSKVGEIVSDSKAFVKKRGFDEGNNVLITSIYDSVPNNAAVVKIDFEGIKEAKDKNEFIDNILSSLDRELASSGEDVRFYLHSNLLDPLYAMDNKSYLETVGEYFKDTYGIDHPTYTKYLQERVASVADLLYNQQVAYRRVIHPSLKPLRDKLVLAKYFKKEVNKEDLKGATHIMTSGISKVFSSAQRRYITKNIFVDLGQIDGKRVFGYVRDIVGDSYFFNLFGLEMLVKIPSSKISPKEFDAIQQELIDNNC